VKQLVKDKSEVVREALAKNFAILISYVDGAEKLKEVTLSSLVGKGKKGKKIKGVPTSFFAFYLQFREVVRDLMHDQSILVKNACRKILIPVFFSWAFSHETSLDKTVLPFIKDFLDLTRVPFFESFLFLFLFLISCFLFFVFCFSFFCGF